ncbi:hypothetical protein F511_31859 [Dorcoceras hygrometricum]|uniref:Uncharacterized protein n=1 Tax=Dorcoceras hygrometricum TaxID=472368 RepID=A0A2Z7DGE2_9LAMI|nr:hypothetical protein F511_31859 [Dorcoceras hygrometricum]
MSWRDHAHTLSPSTPEQAPDLTNFLEAMSEKCFNAQELIEEDSYVTLVVVGKRGEPTRKEPPALSIQVKGRRRPRRGERRKKHRHEEKNKESAQATVSKCPISEPQGTAGKAPEQQSTEAPYVLLDTSVISFVAKPFGSVSLDFVRCLVPDQDFDLVKSVPFLAALEAADLHFMQALVWSGEVENRLTQAQDEVVMTQRSMDGVLDRHNDLMKQLDEIRAQKDKEKESVLLELEAIRAEAQSSKAQILQIICSEEENKPFRLRWRIFFEQGFNGCLAQVRANGYSEEEHHALFLDVEQAFADMPEDEDSEEGSSGREEAPPA